MATEENYRNVLGNFYTTPSQRNENYTGKSFNGLDVRMAIFLRQLTVSLEVTPWNIVFTTTILKMLNNNYCTYNWRHLHNGAIA